MAKFNTQQVVDGVIYLNRDADLKSVSKFKVQEKVMTFSTFYQGTNSEDTMARCHSNEFHCGYGDEIIVNGDFTGIKAAIASENGYDSGWFTQTGKRIRVAAAQASDFFVNVAKTDGTSEITPADIDLVITVIDNHTEMSNMPYILEQNKESLYGNIIPLKGITKNIVSNGITIQQNDGTITVNGTATGDVYINVMPPTELPALPFALTGGAEGGGWGNYGVMVYKETAPDEFEEYIGDYGNGRTVIPDEPGRFMIDIRIWNGKTVSNLEFTPELKLIATDSNYGLDKTIRNNEITEAIKNVGPIQWTKDSFIQGRRNSITDIATDSARCTTEGYFEAEKGDVVIVRNESNLVRYALIGDKDNGTPIFDSKWQIYDKAFTIEKGGFYFINVSKWNDNGNITPADVTVSYSLIKATKEPAYKKASALMKTAYSGEEIRDMTEDAMIEKMIIELPPDESGYTSVTITKQSHNYAVDVVYQSGSIGSNGENIGGSNRFRTENFYAIEPNEEYILDYTEDVENGVFFYDENQTFIKYLAFATKNRTFRTPENACWYRLSIAGEVYPSDTTIYKKEDDVSLTINIGTIAGSAVYGGKIELEKDGSGTITRQYKKVNGSDLSWSKNSAFDHTFNGPLTDIAAYKWYDKETGGVVMLDGYTPQSSNNVGYIDKGIGTGVDGDVIYITNEDYSDATSFATYIANKKILYPLKTKPAYNFEDDDISKLLEDSNAIFSCDNGVMKLIYHADTQKVIDEQESPSTKEYFREEIIRTVESVKALQTEPCLVFPLTTDIHYGHEGRKPFLFDETWKNMKAVAEKIRFDAVVCLGDLTEGDFTETKVIEYGSHVSNLLRKFDAPYILAIGNHDDNRYGTQISTANMYKAYFAYTYNKTIWNRNSYGEDYYVDFPEYKVRFICLDSVADGTYKFPTDTVTWFTTVALDTPDDYLAVLLTHLSPIATHNYGENVPANSTAIVDAINDYIEGGKPFIELYGHSHAETSFTSPYLSIGFNCTKFEINNGDPEQWPEGAVKPFRAENNYTEDSWDVVVLRPGSRKINMVKFGAGEDREFSY